LSQFFDWKIEVEQLKTFSMSIGGIGVQCNVHNRRGQKQFGGANKFACIFFHLPKYFQIWKI